MSEENPLKPISISRPGSTKILEHYSDFYIVAQRGWRVKLANTGSVANDRSARLMVSEMDIQELLYLAGKCGSPKGAELPEVDIRKVQRTKPFFYSIADSEQVLE